MSENIEMYPGAVVEQEIAYQDEIMTIYADTRVEYLLPENLPDQVGLRQQRGKSARQTTEGPK